MNKDDFRLAVNLFDLDRITESVRDVLLRGNVSQDQAVRMDKDRDDEVGAVFCCDLLKAATICDIIRAKDRQAGDYPSRIYLAKHGVWTKLTADAALLYNSAGKVRLNPKLFGVDYAPAVPLPPATDDLGTDSVAE